MGKEEGMGDYEPSPNTLLCLNCLREKGWYYPMRMGSCYCQRKSRTSESEDGNIKLENQALHPFPLSAECQWPAGASSGRVSFLSLELSNFRVHLSVGVLFNPIERGSMRESFCQRASKQNCRPANCGPLLFLPLPPRV